MNIKGLANGNSSSNSYDLFLDLRTSIEKCARTLASSGEDGNNDNIDGGSNSGSYSGCPATIEMVQIVEEYLLRRNVDPTLPEVSAWDVEMMRMRDIGGNGDSDGNKGVAIAGLCPYNNNYCEEEKGDNRRDEDDDTENYDDEDADEIEMEFTRRIEMIESAEKERMIKLRMGGIIEIEEREIDEDNDDVDIYDNGDNEGEDDNIDDNRFVPSSSRYKNDFEELGVLGQGGGGEVVKVRNRLDKRICKWMLPKNEILCVSFLRFVNSDIRSV